MGEPSDLQPGFWAQLSFSIMGIRRCHPARALTFETYVTKRRKSTKIITNLLVEELLRPVCTQPSETNWPHYRPGRDHPTGAELDCNLVLDLSKRIVRREDKVLELKSILGAFRHICPRTCEAAAERLSTLEVELVNLRACLRARLGSVFKNKI